MVAAGLSNLLVRCNLYLGHGRGIETFFALVLLTWGCQILWSPEALWQSVALRDYYWVIPNYYIGIAIFVTGMITSIGIATNISGISYSRFFRMAASLLSIGIWIFMLSNIFQETGGYSGTVPWYLWAIPANARLFYLAHLNLPRPGDGGQFVWPSAILP